MIKKLLDKMGYAPKQKMVETAEPKRERARQVFSTDDYKENIQTRIDELWVFRV